MKITRTMAALAATAGLGLVAVPVLAQDSTDTPTDTATTDTATTDDSADASEPATVDQSDTWPAGTDDSSTTDVRDHHGPGPFGEELAQDLADELGIDVDDVTAALDAIRDRRQDERAATMEEFRADVEERRTQALEDAVADGTLTREQSDLLTQLWADRSEARDAVDLDSLTDAQREALDAFRDAVGDAVGGEFRGPGGEGHGRRGPGGSAGHGFGPGRSDDDATPAPDATPDATVQDSALPTT